MRINIYDSKEYFIKENGKWYLINKKNGKREMTKNDCDIDVLESGSNNDEVYGFAVFGY